MTADLACRLAAVLNGKTATCDERPNLRHAAARRLLWWRFAPVSPTSTISRAAAAAGPRDARTHTTDPIGQYRSADHDLSPDLSPPRRKQSVGRVRESI